MSTLTPCHDTICASASRRQTPAAASLAGLLRVWVMRWKTRRDLAELDHRMLTDIGLDPVRAAMEAEKPFWRA